MRALVFACLTIVAGAAIATPAHSQFGPLVPDRHGPAVAPDRDHRGDDDARRREEARREAARREQLQRVERDRFERREPFDRQDDCDRGWDRCRR
jgi:hypothetical protein